jgi:hypothetical protein
MAPRFNLKVQVKRLGDSLLPPAEPARKAPHGMVLSPNGLNASPIRRKRRTRSTFCSDFACESEEFNGPKCKRQCRSCKPKKQATHPSVQWEDYRVDIGSDGKYGIYTRNYNCRLATFNVGTLALQTRLRLLFDKAHQRRHDIGGMTNDIEGALLRAGETRRK